MRGTRVGEMVGTVNAGTKATGTRGSEHRDGLQDGELKGMILECGYRERGFLWKPGERGEKTFLLPERGAGGAST